MRVKIKKVSDYIHRTRGIYCNDVYEVIQANNNLGKFNNEIGYLIQGRRGTPVTMYDYEVEVTEDPVTKTYSTAKVILTALLILFI